MQTQETGKDAFFKKEIQCVTKLNVILAFHFFKFNARLLSDSAKLTHLLIYFLFSRILHCNSPNSTMYLSFHINCGYCVKQIAVIF